MSFLIYIAIIFIMRKTLRLFPYLKDKSKVTQLKIDKESIHYITVREYSNKIAEIITDHLKRINITENIVITDCTAGVGGDTLTFGRFFNKIYAIEINKLRSEYLQNNINLYDFKNITVINDNCINYIPTIYDHNVIYVDPPWEPNGIGSYKNYSKLTLPFCGMQLENFCNKMFDSSYMKHVPSLVLLKLPKNYDMTHFYNNIHNKYVYYYDLGKMIILVLLNNNIVI